MLKRYKSMKMIWMSIQDIVIYSKIFHNFETIILMIHMRHLAREACVTPSDQIEEESKLQEARTWSVRKIRKTVMKMRDIVWRKLYLLIIVRIIFLVGMQTINWLITAILSPSYFQHVTFLWPFKVRVKSFV